jgi:hypothetical protein
MLVPRGIYLGLSELSKLCICCAGIALVGLTVLYGACSCMHAQQSLCGEAGND